MKVNSEKAKLQPSVKSSWVSELIKNRYLYLLMVPALVYLVLVEYRAMYGIILAFKDYNARLGITMSPWVGLKHFKGMWTDSYFIYVFFNTIKLSFGRLLCTFWPPILLALLFSELKQRHLKKTLQTVYTFPHFLSWVIVSGIIINLFAYNGPVNSIVAMLGGERHVFMGDKRLIVPILYISDIWKGAGWSSIIYLAAITSINEELYEAAELDGASRFQKMWHITLPSIRGTILMLLTIAIGGLVSGNLDQIMNMSNAVTQQTVDILDTYIYRITFQQVPDYAYSTAVGLFKSVISITLVRSLDYVSKKIEGTGILS